MLNASQFEHLYQVVAIAGDAGMSVASAVEATWNVVANVGAGWSGMGLMVGF